MCSSPETLVRLDNGRLTTFPVAGSRPRGKTPEEDKALENELLADEKELSEHNMLVDLGRNDLGRVSKIGTVEVTDYMMIHRYSKIMHICSQVEGDIDEKYDACDAIEAVLPAGTLSGAPKIRACEIIEEQESEPRGVYGGALAILTSPAIWIPASPSAWLPRRTAQSPCRRAVASSRIPCRITSIWKAQTRQRQL